MARIHGSYDRIVMTRERSAPNLPDMPVKEREVQVGDEILAWVLGRTRRVRITKVTKMYVWFEYTVASSGQAHNTKCIRGIALLHSKYY